MQTDVLEITQMYDVLNVLKALIIMIWFSRMGMDLEMIRNIMVRDSELNLQTVYLWKKETLADKTQETKDS